MTKVKILARRLGGTWTYCGMCRWECDDGRAVQGCSRGVDQFDNPLPGGPVWYIYDANGLGTLFYWTPTVPLPVGFIAPPTGRMTK